MQWKVFTGDTPNVRIGWGMKIECVDCTVESVVHDDANSRGGWVGGVEYPRIELG